MVGSQRYKFSRPLPCCIPCYQSVVASVMLLPDAAAPKSAIFVPSQLRLKLKRTCRTMLPCCSSGQQHMLTPGSKLPVHWLSAISAAHRVAVCSTSAHPYSFLKEGAEEASNSSRCKNKSYDMYICACQVRAHVLEALTGADAPAIDSAACEDPSKTLVLHA